MKEYTEEKMGSCRIRLNKLKQKETDRWWKLKGIESGKIHINAVFYERTDEPIQDQPFFTVFQFYLKEVEGMNRFLNLDA